jgi:hypothetical protein
VMLITTAAVHCRSESDSFEMLSYKNMEFKYSILLNWQTHFSLVLCNSCTVVTSSVFHYVFYTTYNTNLCNLPYITTCFDLCCCYKLYLYVWGLSGKYPAIFNISRTGRVALKLGSQAKETFLLIREQSLSRGASQSLVGRCWHRLCAVRSLDSQWPSE